MSVDIACQGGHGFIHVGCQINQLASQGDQDQACIGQLDPATYPEKQRQPEMFFQGLNVLADARLGHLQLLRSLGKIQSFSGCQEYMQLMKIEI
jgi:hypothetical protein